MDIRQPVRGPNSSHSSNTHKTAMLFLFLLLDPQNICILSNQITILIWKMTDSALPKGWTICVSRSKRKIYYYHQETNTVQWSRPGDEENCKNDKIVKKTSNKRQRPNSDSPSIELLIRTSLKAGLSEIQNVFIPWNHQISAINAIMKHLQSENTNNRFLIQHSTGSGKTATMSGLVRI